MADREYVIRVINEAVSQVVAQIGKADKQVNDFQKRYKSAISQAQKTEQALVNAHARSAKEKEKLDRAYRLKSIQLDKARLQTMNKDEEAYWQKKMSIRGRELNLTRNLSAQQRAILKKGYRDQLRDERAKYEKSKELANNLQATLKSVFQRAILYTGIYRGIQIVNRAFRDWIKTNVELDYAIASVNTIAEVSITQFERLKQMSLDTGRSMVDLSNALYEINSAGITGERGMKILEVATRAAVGGFVDAKNAADTITDVLNAYNLGTEDAEMVTSKLLKTVKLGKLRWEEYQGQLGSVLPAAYNLGVSLDDTLGSIATLTLAGIPLNRAITGMRNIMIKFLKPTKGMQDALYQLNTNLGETYGSIQDVIKAKGFIETLRLLGDVTNATDIETVELFNNIRGLTAQLALMNDSGEKATEISAKIAAATNTLNEQYGIMSDTMEEAKNRLATAWEVLGVELFTFADKVKYALDALRALILGLRHIAPFIKGVAAGLSILAIAATVVGAKFLIIKYLIPMLSLSLAGLTKVSAMVTAGSFSMAVSMKTAAGAALVLQASLGALTLVAAAFIAAYTTTQSIIEKNRREAAAAKEAFDNMNQAFRESISAADTLSRTRPFKGMNIKEITKQLADNNKLLKRREELLGAIERSEARIAHMERYGVSEKRIERQIHLLNQYKGELFIIEGINGRNLEAMQALRDEYRYQKQGLSDIQVSILRVTKGLETLSEASLVEMSLPDLKKYYDTLKVVQRNLVANVAETSGAVQEEWQEKLTNINTVFRVVYQAMSEAEEKFRKEQLDKAGLGEADRLELEKKYRDLRLKEHLEGRIKLLNEEKESEKARAEAMGASAEAILDIEAHFNRLIREEREKHNEILIRQADVQNQYMLKIAEDTQKKMMDLYKVEFDEKKKILSTYMDFRNRYGLDEIQREKQNQDIELRNFERNMDDYKAKFVHTEAEMAEFKAMYHTIKEAMEKEHLERINNLRLAQSQKLFDQWRKQHWYFSMMIDTASDVVQSAISATSDLLALQLQALVNQAKVTSIKLRDIWKAFTNDVMAMLSRMLVRMIAVYALKKMLGFTDFGIGGGGGSLTNRFLMNLLNMAQGKPLNDAIIQNGVITPFRKDDVVAIGTNMYGTRSGYNSGGIEAKLDQVIGAINNGTIALIKKPMVVNVDPINPADINNLNRQGEKINKRIG